MTPTGAEALKEHLSHAVDTLWSHLVRDETHKKILFTGTRRDEGVTTAALCAALGLARHARRRVVLLEADCQSPVLADLLGVDPVPGLRDVLREDREPSAALRRTEEQGLFLVPGGSPGPLPSGAFASERMAELQSALDLDDGFLIADAPPVLDSPESRLLAWSCGVAVPVFRLGRTDRDRARRLLQLLRDLGVDVLGQVLNDYRRQPWIGDAL